MPAVWQKIDYSYIQVCQYTFLTLLKTTIMPVYQDRKDKRVLYNI